MWNKKDMIFTARQLQEKYQEQKVDLYVTYVDLTKALGPVSRDGHWKTMVQFGCLPRFIAMVRDAMQARVQNDGGFSEPFEVMNGVKQGSNAVQHDVFCHVGCSA